MSTKRRTNRPLAALAALLLAGCGGDRPPGDVDIPAEATAVLEEERFQEPPAMAWADLELADGGSVRYAWVRPLGGGERGTVLLLPGFSAPIELYFETIKDFLAARLAVVTLDWPSQGFSSRPLDNPFKIHAESLDPFLSVAVRVVDEVAPAEPVLVVGSSLGGQLGARLIHAHPERFAAAALVAPAFEIDMGDRPEWLARLSAALMPSERYVFGAGDWRYDPGFLAGQSNCGHDPARMQLWQAWMIAKPELKIGGMTFGYLDAMLASADRASDPELLGEIDLPVLVQTAGKDSYVVSETAHQACGAMPRCTLKIYEEAKHCLFEEKDAYREPFMTDLLAFLLTHARPAQDRS